MFASFRKLKIHEKFEFEQTPCKASRRIHYSIACRHQYLNWTIMFGLSQNINAWRQFRTSAVDVTIPVNPRSREPMEYRHRGLPGGGCFYAITVGSTPFRGLRSIHPSVHLPHYSIRENLLILPAIKHWYSYCVIYQHKYLCNFKLIVMVIWIYEECEWYSIVTNCTKDSFCEKCVFLCLSANGKQDTYI